MLIIGHRGAKGLASENTMASLQAALDARVGMVEVDVRVSADNTAILHHDPVLIGTDGKKHLIAKTDFLDLQAAKPDVLTLEAALQFIDRRTDMLIEIKPGQPIDPIVASIKPRIVPGRLESDIILESRDFKLLMQLHIEFPQIPVAIIERWSGVRAGRRAKALGTKRVVMNQKWLWSGFIKSVSKRGWMLSAYTLNDPKKAKRWAKYGLYGVITDYPDRF